MKQSEVFNVHEEFEKDFKQRQKKFKEFKKDNQSKMLIKEREFTNSKNKINKQKSKIESKLKQFTHPRNK